MAPVLCLLLAFHRVWTQTLRLWDGLIYPQPGTGSALCHMTPPAARPECQPPAASRALTGAFFRSPRAGSAHQPQVVRTVAPAAMSPR